LLTYAIAITGVADTLRHKAGWLAEEAPEYHCYAAAIKYTSHAAIAIAVRHSLPSPSRATLSYHCTLR